MKLNKSEGNPSHNMTYYAHSNGPDRGTWQLLQDHLNRTANLAVTLGEDAGLSEFAYVTTLFHDIGKYKTGFQKRLEGAKHHVDHATPGAKEILRIFGNDPNKKLIATLMAFCIAGHHGGLPDFGSIIDTPDDTTLQGRLKRKKEDYDAYLSEIDLSHITFPSSIHLRPFKNHLGFSVSFFTRMLYSILVDADFQETEAFMKSNLVPRGEYLDVISLRDKLNGFLSRFDNPQNNIDEQRTSTLKQCIEISSEKPAYFSLTIPTGGGKTLASMAFALNHAVINDLKRVVYVIPYTSIIEQNAGVFKDILGQDNVLEHHSNFDWEEKQSADTYDENFNSSNTALQKLKLASENWDIPITVTTNVQFFESLFSNRSSRCRKLHNLARSVIIFDEAQMLPRDYLKPCMLAVAELVRNYGASAIFCTATQPKLQQFLPIECIIQEICPDPKGLYKFYRRVKVRQLGKVTDEEILNRIKQNHQALCIVNTRNHARGLFTGLNGEGRFHLSTLMCPAHRKQTIEIIRERLKDKSRCQVISTQIMEAGIDVDFPVGYRALAGLDSIIQAAGRVNREGKLKTGEIYIFEPDSSFVKKNPTYIAQCGEVTRSILRRYPDDPICLEAIEAYYAELYSYQGKQAFDFKNILEYFEKHVTEPNFDFRKAAEEFKLIEESTESIIIPFDDRARRILGEVKKSDYPRSFSRKLQPYTVNIYKHEMQALRNHGLVDTILEAFDVLNNCDQYDRATGLIIPEHSGGDGIYIDR